MLHHSVWLQALVTLDHIQPEQLRPEFRDGVASLLKLILQKVSRLWRCACMCVACVLPSFWQGTALLWRSSSICVELVVCSC